MSLTTFLSQPEIRNGFRAVIKKQQTFKPNKPMLAPPLTTNYALVGTAFDYLLRFYLERINPTAETKRWVAKAGIMMIEDEQTRELAKRVFHDAQKLYRDYLQDGMLTDELIASSLRLACLDGAYRGRDKPFNKDGLMYLAERDVEDLRQLMSLVKEQNFKSQKACYLNPTFGLASRLVGGADADIIIDNKIIEIKTTKNLRLEASHLQQLLGYYVLLSLGGIDVKDGDSFQYFDEISEIDTLSIYFSRHGYLHIIKISDLIALESLPNFVKWFIKTVCSDEKKFFDYCKNFRGQTAKQFLNESVDESKHSNVLR